MEPLDGQRASSVQMVKNYSRWKIDFTLVFVFRILLCYIALLYFDSILFYFTAEEMVECIFVFDRFLFILELK